MTDLAVQATISTPTGGLNLETEGAFELIAIGAGGRTWRRHTVEGPFMAGRVLLGAVLDTGTLTILVRARGASWVAATNRAKELFDALAQHTYTVTSVIDGRTDVYVCEPADIRDSAGDTLSKFHVMEQMVEYIVTIPIQPK